MSKRLEMRVDDELMEKIEYLKKIYGFRTTSEVIRWVIEVTYRKEK